MENAAVETPGAVAIEPPSTVLNPETVKTTSGGGKVSAGSEANSIQSVLEGELTRLKDEDAKAEKPADDKAKAEPVEKDDKAEKKPDDKAAKPRAEDGKFAKAEKTADEQEPAKAEKGEAEKPATERSGAEEPRQSEGRKYAEPPARFLPEARAKWANVPNEIKAEFHRAMQEVDTEREASREAVETFETVRRFHDMAKQSGTTLEKALGNFVAAEQGLRTAPLEGIANLLRHYLGVTPQQYAEHVLKNPAEHQFAPQSLRQQTEQQPAPQVQALEQKVQALETQLMSAAVTPVIERFAATHSDYYDKQTQIAAVLKSGVIENIYGTGLSPDQKLAEAYRMAGGQSPSRPTPEPGPVHSDAPKARPVDPDGQKSIRGAPADGTDSAIEEASSDLREILRREHRRMSA